MKRISLIAILLGVILCTAACAAYESTKENLPIDWSEDIEKSEYLDIVNHVDAEKLITVEHLIEDLEYMIYVLENNFALLEVANWAHGIDYRELAAAARASMLARDEICKDAFFAILGYYFWPLYNTGHFSIISFEFFADLSEHYRELGERHAAELDEIGEKNVKIFSSIETERFYGNINIGRRDIQTRVSRGLLGASIPPIDRFYATRITQHPDFRIIEKDKIVYFSTGSNSTQLSEAAPEIHRFLRSTRTDFLHRGIESQNKHLIIDLRGNGGGHVPHFLNALMRPFLRSEIESPQAFLFFMDGSYIRRFSNELDYGFYSRGISTVRTTEAYSPINELLDAFSFVDIHDYDIARLSYGAPALFDFRLAPIAATPTFEGNIWLLVDEGVGSAAQVFAWLAKETGFATLVGETTGGNFGGYRTYAFMPNTGIMFRFDLFYITDSHGRPLEAGTIPHHFNSPGMDALQTVLALIEEGEY